MRDDRHEVVWAFRPDITPALEIDLDAQVVATMVAGRWVHNPPPWD
jgi:hypothetical protein